MRTMFSSSIAVLLLAGNAMAQDGPATVEGVVTSESFIFQPQYWPNPTVALLDATGMVAGRFDRFVPAENQILGQFVDPLFTGEGRYRIDLPIVPPGGRLDLNGDGTVGLGIFTLVSAPNLSSDSYLEQLEQNGGLFSILLDQRTGVIGTGILLLYSEDGAEAFPAENTQEDGWAGTCPVQTFPPNGFGLFEMTGNVWEWCADWFATDAYCKSPLHNPRGPDRGQARVIRGGSYLCHASYFRRYRVDARRANTPDSSAGNIGFRVARDL